VKSEPKNKMINKVKAKKRADQLLVDQSLVESRTKAQALILAGSVEFKKNDRWEEVKKAGDSFLPDTEFRIEDATLADVGRGAQKLRGAFQAWPEIQEKVIGKVGLDIGSSTGGFTQVLLEKGAARVVALDVGTHQLHERLRKDQRVLSLEQTHVLHVNESFWAEKNISLPFDFFVTDVSFISVTKILAHAHAWLRSGAFWVLLVKPQFELEAKKVPRGIVKDPVFRKEALDRVLALVEGLDCFKIIGQIDSPITGADGNVEYLICLQKL
jgi:23S rRNA (cytidine1920-2'-O)/16S rRNA (cytidine1409-2'-O)-methyltransferase